MIKRIPSIPRPTKPPTTPPTIAPMGTPDVCVGLDVFWEVDGVEGVRVSLHNMDLVGPTVE